MKKFKSRFKLNWIHFKALTERYFKIILSDRLSLLFMLLQGPLMALIIKLTLVPRFTYVRGMFAMFEITVMAIFIGILNSYREVSKEREVLLREYGGGLNGASYILSKITVQSFFCLIHTLFIGTAALLVVNFPLGDNKIFTIILFYIIIYLTLLASISIGLFISCILKKAESAILPVLFLIIAQVVLSGAMMEIDKLEWLSDLTIARWGCEAMGNIFDLKSIVPATIDMTTGQIVPGTLRYCFSGELWQGILVLCLLIILPVILSILTITNANHNKADE